MKLKQLAFHKSKGWHPLTLNTKILNFINRKKHYFYHIYADFYCAKHRFYNHHTNDENPGNGARDPAVLFMINCPEFKLIA